jgi:3'-phosphoadenosine 5'-phosphosulfate sulfotransferase (PAPS reductase)/FAD synthetase
MNERWRETFLTFSKLEEHRKRVETAKAIIQKALRVCKKPYVAFSGGKDSLCVLHLVSSMQKDVFVVHWDYGRYFIPRDLHEEILEIAKQFSSKVMVFTSDRYEKEKRKAYNVLGEEFFEKIVPKLMEEGFDCVLLGLRKEESSSRRVRIKNQLYLTPIREFYPIANWTWLDVWAYIVSNNIKYLSIYDKYGEVLGYDRARFTTLFDRQFDKYGTENIDGVLMWRFKHIE